MPSERIEPSFLDSGENELQMVVMKITIEESL